MAIRVLRPDGSTAVDLREDGRGLQAVAYAPIVGDSRLLALHQRRGRWEPFIVDVTTGGQAEIDLGLPGDVEVSWFADGEALLVQHLYHARTELYRYHLAARVLVPLPVPRGTVQDAKARSDGSVWYLWSDGAHPPIFASTGEAPGLSLPGATPPTSEPVTDAWVQGDYEPVHALVNRPARGTEPYATVFLIHGGPEDHDADQYDREVAAWVDHGFAVVRVNYRGSTGYGRAWTEALRERVGLIELEDIAAVRRSVVDQGVADPTRLILAGSSWGGYLTLLGLGIEPETWAVGLANAPVADYVAAYEDAMEEVKALDRALFRGSPDDVPDRYSASSPLTDVGSVRAPILITAGVNDARCPIRQVENYVVRLAELGLPHEFHRYRAGHHSAIVDEQVELFRRQLAFVRSHLAGAP